MAGEPLFVFEGRGARSTLKCGPKTWKPALPPERVFEVLGTALAGRAKPGFWPLINAFGYEAGGRFERLPRAPSGALDLPDWWAFLPGLWAWWDPKLKRWRRARAGLDASTARALARALGLPLGALEPARRAPEAAWTMLRRQMKRAVPPPPPAPAPLRPRSALEDSMGKAGYCRGVRAIR
ncbi:MAG TPA: hypothetical protein VK786_06190, partial [bacterium]|nr:hypothetical protein [bacterium]